MPIRSNTVNFLESNLKFRVIIQCLFTVARTLEKGQKKQTGFHLFRTYVCRSLYKQINFDAIKNKVRNSLSFLIVDEIFQIGLIYPHVVMDSIVIQISHLISGHVNRCFVCQGVNFHSKIISSVSVSIQYFLCLPTIAKLMRSNDQKMTNWKNVKMEFSANEFEKFKYFYTKLQQKCAVGHGSDELKSVYFSKCTDKTKHKHTCVSALFQKSTLAPSDFFYDGYGAR